MFIRMLVIAVAVMVASPSFAAQTPDKTQCADLAKVHITCDFSGSQKPHAPNSSSIDVHGKIHVYGADGLETWYDRDVKPITLKAVFAEDLRFLGPDNTGYRMPGGSQLCDALTAVAVPCDYNHRTGLTMFLTVWGKAPFPAEGGTNPYFQKREEGPDGFPDDYYIGTATQNAMLARAVRRNAHLFRHGDLTAEAVKHWR